MLDILDSGYVIEYCIAAIVAERRMEACQIYLGDMLRAIAMGLGAKGITSLADILHPPKVEKRNPEEIVNDITAKAGLKAVKKKHERNEPDGDIGN